MNKYSFIVLSIVVLAIFVWSQTGPFQDRSSDEYKIWHKSHVAELERAYSFQKLILDNNFKFDSLQFVEVSPGSKYFSWWGHCLLRLVGSGKEGPDSDLMISFLADFNDFPLNKLKASFGGYDIFVKVDTLAQYKVDYSEKEDRTFDFYNLKTNTVQNNDVLTKLREWIRTPQSAGTYSFFFMNCVGLMNKLFFETKILKENGYYGYFTKYVKYRYENVGLLDTRSTHYEKK